METKASRHLEKIVSGADGEMDRKDHRPLTHKTDSHQERADDYHSERMGTCHTLTLI